MYEQNKPFDLDSPQRHISLRHLVLMQKKISALLPLPPCLTLTFQPARQRDSDGPSIPTLEARMMV